MQRVVLLGELGQKFGENWDMNVNYINDIFKLIACQRKGFQQYMLDCHEAGTDFTIKRGKEFIGEEELLLTVYDEDIVISAVPAGSKSGIGKILAAIVIIVVTWGYGATIVAAGKSGAVAAGSSTLSALGQAGFMASMKAASATFMGSMAIGMATSFAMQGISQLMMPGPEIDKETPDNYLFNGNSEHIKEGLPIPLCYGEMLVGGGLINQTLTTSVIYSGGMRRGTNTRDNSGDFGGGGPG